MNIHIKAAVITIGAVAALAGCSARPGPVGPAPAPTTTVLAPCPAGEVTVWAGEPVGCDLIGGVNMLVELGGTEADCDQAGGRWIYEACEGMDF